MFLFRWAFGLMRGVVRLVTLPLRLLGLPVTVLYMPFRFILKMFARHTVGFLVVVLMIYLFFHFRASRERLLQLTPAPAPHATIAQPVLVDPVLKYENGDSNFATDLYAQMSDPERAEYSKQYYHAMNTLRDGATHQWSSYNIAGAIRVNSSFMNNSGDRCRRLSETLKVHTVQQTISGTACAQGKATWCKLKPNATPLCGLGKTSGGGMFGGFSRALGNLF